VSSRNESHKTSEYDPAKSLVNAEGIAHFVNDAFETANPDYITMCIGVAVRAKGLAEVSTKTELSPDELQHLFGEKGNPELKIALAVMQAIGLQIQIKSSIEPSQPEGQSDKDRPD